MNINAQQPNRFLRYARQERGWSQQRLAEQIGTTEDVISRWERGARNPSPYYRERLCQLFGKNAQELGLLQPLSADGNHRAPVQRERVKHKGPIVAYLEPFSFATLQTTWIVVEGDGTYQYASHNIQTHFEDKSEELPADLQAQKKQIEEDQINRRASGLPFHWNGKRYSLNRFIISRDGLEEHLVLDLWFTPSDYYTFLATNMSLDDRLLRRKYLLAVDWSQPTPFFSNSFGTYLLVITADKKILLTHRGRELGSRPGEYNVSVCEGLSLIDANESALQAPSLYSCAERGLLEELGLQVQKDFEPEDIRFLSLGVDSWYSQWGVLGLVTTNRTAQEIINYRKNGVKDRLENAQIYAINYDVEEILAFVLRRRPWAPGGLACLYHALVFTFGRSTVEDALNRLHA
jgi:transcriptional regulator with XRE-family HTH domain